MYQLTENGFIVKMYDEMNYNAKTSFNRKHALYENLDSYIEENTGFDNLEFENYENIFKLHIFASLLALFLFLAIKCIKKYTKYFKKLKIRL